MGFICAFCLDFKFEFYFFMVFWQGWNVQFWRKALVSQDTLKLISSTTYPWRLLYFLFFYLFDTMITIIWFYSEARVSGVCKLDGLAGEILRHQPPVDLWRKFIYCTSLTGQVLGSVDHMQPKGAYSWMIMEKILIPWIDYETMVIEGTHS